MSLDNDCKTGGEKVSSEKLKILAGKMTFKLSESRWLSITQVFAYSVVELIIEY